MMANVVVSLYVCFARVHTAGLESPMVKAKDPGTCKRLGRQVKGFDNALWEKHLQETANEVVTQKFAGNAQLRKLLLSIHHEASAANPR